MRHVIGCFAALALCACGGGGGGGGSGGGGDDGGGATEDVAFQGEISAFPGYGYDSGWLPDASPIQVKLLFQTEGALKAVADATVGGSGAAPIMSGKAGSGTYEISVKLIFQVLIKVDFAAVSYEGPVDENADISFAIAGETTFDPFLIDGAAMATADIPETEMARIPLAGSIPAVTGDVVIVISGKVNSEFKGVCAAVNETSATYHGVTETSAALILKPSVEIEIPFVLEEKLEAFDVPVDIPAVQAALDLGTLEVTPGGGPVDAGGSLAQVGTCEPATEDTGADTTDTGTDTTDTGTDTTDTGADTSDTGPDTGDTGADTGDTGGDTGDTGGDTGDTGADTGDTGDTGVDEVDPASQWDVIVVDAEVLGAEPDGGWDLDGSLPDLYVRFGAVYTEADGYTVNGETTTKDDTLSADYDEAVIIGVTAAELLDGGLSAYLFDEDLIGEDELGSCSFTVFESDFGGEPASSCGSFGTFEARFMLVPSM